MASLRKAECVGEVVWLGHVPAQGGSLRARAQERLIFSFDGIDGERHQGARRASCSRVSNLYPVGSDIRNVRQVSVLSEEELGETARAMGLEALDPALLGATVVLRGIGDFSHLPPSTRLQGPDGVTLVVDMLNRPCVYPAREIEAEAKGHGDRFIAAARGRRGLTGWVERPGALALGERLTVFVPDQRPWQGEPD